MYRKPVKETDGLNKSIELVEIEDEPTTEKEAKIYYCKTCPETFKMSIALNKHECRMLEQSLKRKNNLVTDETVQATSMKEAKQEFVDNKIRKQGKQGMLKKDPAFKPCFRKDMNSRIKSPELNL